MIRGATSQPPNKPACVLRRSRLMPPPWSSASSGNCKNVPWQRKRPLNKPPQSPRSSRTWQPSSSAWLLIKQPPRLKRHASKPQQSPRSSNRTWQPNSSAWLLNKPPPKLKKHANKPQQSRHSSSKIWQRSSSARLQRLNEFANKLRLLPCSVRPMKPRAVNRRPKINVRRSKHAVPPKNSKCAPNRKRSAALRKWRSAKPMKPRVVNRKPKCSALRSRRVPSRKLPSVLRPKLRNEPPQKLPGISRSRHRLGSEYSDPLLTYTRSMSFTTCQ